MNDTEEVRTVWSWDTTNVEMASKRIEQHFAKVDAAEKRSVQASAANKKAQTSAGGGGHGGGGHGGTSNFGMGIHDTLMGRGTAGLFRFGNAAKLAAGYASGMAIAVELGGKAMSYAAGEIEKTDRAAERLEASFIRVSKAATFATVGEGSGKLSGTKDSLLEQIQGERAQQGDLQNQKLMQDAKPFVDPVTGEATLSAGGLFYKAKDRVSSALFGTETVEDKIRGSELRERAAGQEYGALSRKATDAYGTERDIAFQKSYAGNPFEAQRLESSKKEEVELSQESSRPTRSDENLARIREKFAIEREGINRSEAAANRQLDLELAITRARREGGAVEVRTAKERMDAAGRTLATTLPGTRAFDESYNAFAAAKQSVLEAERTQGLQRADFRFGQQTAGFRGNDDDRAKLSAQVAVDKATERLRILRETHASEEEINAAILEQTQSLTAQVMLERQQQMARLKLASDIARAPQTVRAAGALLGGASSEQAERAGAVDQVQAAQAALALATKRVQIEKGSREAIEGQVAAAEALAKAQISLALHDQQVRRERRYEMQGAQTETAALRLSASGRDDLAELSTQRNQSQIAIEHANQDGKPQLARELAAQQRLRETKSVEDMYLNPDGTPRRGTDVQRDMNQRRLRESRVKTFRDHLNENGGLMSVHRDMRGGIESGVDPLTGVRLNGRQIADRNAAASAKIDTKAEQGTDNELLGKIFTALDSRLPKEVK